MHVAQTALATACDDEFLARFTEASAAIRQGDPRDEGTDIGPLITREHFERVDGFVRRAKDEAELVLIKRAIHATAAGHAVAREMIRPGVSERQIQIAMEAAMMEAGADCTGYASIVGTGSNSAIFHFTPSGRTVSDGDFVLIDAGAEVDGYVADVTRIARRAVEQPPVQHDAAADTHRDDHRHVVRAAACGAEPALAQGERLGVVVDVGRQSVPLLQPGGQRELALLLDVER